MGVSANHFQYANNPEEYSKLFIKAHNTSEEAHPDIRKNLSAVSNELSATGEKIEEINTTVGNIDVLLQTI